jgi:hypothetical protein
MDGALGCQAQAHDKNKMVEKLHFVLPRLRGKPGFGITFTQIAAFASEAGMVAFFGIQGGFR